MLTSLAFILLCGLLLGAVFQKLRLPSLLGMLLTGILLGPQVLNLIDSSILSISADLRQLALIIILIRAGLSLDLDLLKKVGRPAILMCFVPACFEIGGMLLLGPRLLGISIVEAGIIGCVLAAVSPAVIVPNMIRLSEAGYGVKKGIPQLIMAGAAVDDIFVIVLFTSVLSLAQGASVSAVTFVSIPLSIVAGILLGAVCGFGLSKLFHSIHMRDSIKVLILLSTAFLLVALENNINAYFPVSGLIAVMCVGILLLRTSPKLAVRLSSKFSKLWVFAEVVLFVLVGTTVDLHYAVSAGGFAVILLLLVLCFRMAGVFCCMIKTNLSVKERLFCMLAYIPKATVQAAIGGIPLAAGLACGQLVLTMAVLAILITAPLGVFLINITYKKLLEKHT